MTIEVKWSEQSNLPELPKDHEWVIHPGAVIIERTLSTDRKWREHSLWYCSCNTFWFNLAKLDIDKRTTTKTVEIPRTLLDKILRRTRTEEKRVTECRITRMYQEVSTVYTNTVVTEGNVREFALKALVQLEADRAKAEEAQREADEHTRAKVDNAHLYGRYQGGSNE